MKKHGVPGFQNNCVPVDIVFHEKNKSLLSHSQLGFMLFAAKSTLNDTHGQSTSFLGMLYLELKARGKPSTWGSLALGARQPLVTRVPACRECWSVRSREKDRDIESCGLNSSASKFLFLPKMVDAEFLSLANRSPT